MNKDLKTFLIIFGSLCMLFLGVLVFSIKNNLKNNLSYDFAGIVEAVVYNVKGTPTVTINKKKYCLSAGYNFDLQIEKGDTLKKRRMSTIYVLIKRKTHSVMTFNN
jgi:hypothetical protein